MEETVYEFSAPLLKASSAGDAANPAAFSLGAFRGQVLLIVNTASYCGFTPQYAGLEQLYNSYRERGFVVLGFPCNQFGAQEPGSEVEIGAFCEKNFGVTFPLFSRIDVNGPRAHPLYCFLKKARPGLFGFERIKWNFTKFLVDRKGHVAARFGSSTPPNQLASAIERLLDRE
jgi:glutathione peroxidase